MRQILPALLLCLAMLVAFGCSDDEEAKTTPGESNASVKNAAVPSPTTRLIIAEDMDGKPISAQVSALFPSAQTPVAPTTSGVSIPDATTKIHVQAAGYLGREVTLSPSTEEYHARLFALAAITLNVTTPAGKALPNLLVTMTRTVPVPAGLLEPTGDGKAMPLQPQLVSTLLTDENGQVRLSNLVPKARYEFAVKRDGFAEGAKAVVSSLEPAASEQLEILSTNETWLWGRLKLKDFYRFDGAGAHFKYQVGAEDRHSSIEVHPDGRFLLPAAACKQGQFIGAWTNDVDGSEYRVTRSLDLAEGEVVGLGDLELVKLWVVMGHIKRDGEPLTKGSVQLAPLNGLSKQLDAEGGFRLPGIEKSLIFADKAEFYLVVYSEDGVTRHDVTTAVRRGDLIEINIDASERREVKIVAVGATGNTDWRVQPLASFHAAVKSGEGVSANLKLYPGSYRVWMRSGDTVGFGLLDVFGSGEEDAEVIQFEVVLGPTKVITPKLGAGIGQATFLLFNENWQPLGLEVISLFRGADMQSLATKWRVPPGKYKIRASMLGRSLEYVVDCREEDQEIVVE